MIRLALGLLFALVTSAAWAQNPTCPTRPVGDNSNACASTAFVSQNAVTSAEIRERLTASRTYYVRTAGNDTNCSGLTNVNDPGSGTLPRACAFATPQKPVNTILDTIDISGFSVIIELTGAFTSGVSCKSGILGAAAISVTSTAGASITTTSANAIEAAFGCNLGVTGNITVSTITEGTGIAAYANGRIAFSGITFGSTVESHIQAGGFLGTTPGTSAGGGIIFVTGNYSITGGAVSHLHATADGAQIQYLASGITVTITGTPAFSAYFVGISKGLVYADGLTFVGAATGRRHYVHRDGTLVVPAAAGRSFFPGDSAGVVQTGGHYMEATDLLADLGVINVVGQNVVAPSTPVAGYTWGWFDSTDKRWHDKNDAGTVGTTVVGDTGASNNFLTAINPLTGVISKAQPSFSNLSGSATAAQLPTIAPLTALGNVGTTTTTPSAIAVREKLAAARTYYVRVDGNDTNCTGLTDAAYVSGSYPQNCGFITIQKPYNVVTSTLDLGGQTLTIQVRDGTYSPASGTSPLSITQPWTGGGSVMVVGNSGTPANVVFNATSAPGIRVQTNLPGILYLRNFKIVATVSHGILLQGIAAIYYQGINFGAVGAYHVFANTPGAQLFVDGNYTISGSPAGGSHWVVNAPAQIFMQGWTVTLTGTPAFVGGFAVATAGGTIQVPTNTFSGAATGPRYLATENGVITVAGAGTNYLPGNAAGSTATGGQYNFLLGRDLDPANDNTPMWLNKVA